MKLRTLLSVLMVLVLATGALASSKKPANDDQLYDLVIRKLADDPVVKGGALKVDVHDGVVTISGKVETDQQKAKAEKIVKKISGVKQVDNQLVVVGKGNR
jgi:hyperosmotically inducible protein